MGDELRNLEQTLQGMPLRKVPASLDGKVVRPGGSRVMRRVLIGGMAAAVAIVVVLLLAPWQGDPEKTPLSDNVVETDSAPEGYSIEETVSDLSYEGLIVLHGKTPMRVLRHRIIERTWAVDKLTGHTLEMTVPREQIFLVTAEVY